MKSVLSCQYPLRIFGERVENVFSGISSAIFSTCIHSAFISWLCSRSLVLKKCNFSPTVVVELNKSSRSTEHSNKWRSKLLRNFINESHAITIMIYEIMIFSSIWKNIQLSFVIIHRCSARYSAIGREMLKGTCAWKLSSPNIWMLHLFGTPLNDLVKIQRDILAQTRMGIYRSCYKGGSS